MPCGGTRDIGNSFVTFTLKDGLTDNRVTSILKDSKSCDLELGGFVVLYSDGVSEAVNEAGEIYGDERLLEAVQQADSGLSAQDMVDLIVKDVTEFVGDVEPSDDITIVVLRCDESQ